MVASVAATLRLPVAAFGAGLRTVGELMAFADLAEDDLPAVVSTAAPRGVAAFAGVFFAAAFFATFGDLLCAFPTTMPLWIRQRVK